jgi:hypothetical protein
MRRDLHSTTKYLSSFKRTFFHFHQSRRPCHKSFGPSHHPCRSCPPTPLHAFPHHLTTQATGAYSH